MEKQFSDSRYDGRMARLTAEDRWAVKRLVGEAV